MGRGALATTLCLAAVVSSPGGAAGGESEGNRADRSAKVTVGSKNFAENRLLAEMFAQLIEEHTDLEVERRLGLAGTDFCLQALRNGAIDLYPEYTGTGWVSILNRQPLDSSYETLVATRSEFRRRWDLWWLSPLGFENAYEIAVPRRVAERYGLKTLSDLTAVAPQLRAGFGNEFVERPDGLPGLRTRYGLDFASVQSFLQTPKYQAAASGNLEVLDVYTTDGRLLTYDLVILKDDLGFFPPYEAAPLVRGEALRELPGLGAALGLLGGGLDGDLMRRLNLELQENKSPVEAVARQALEDLGLLQSEGSEDDPAPLLEMASTPWWKAVWEDRHAIARWTAQHVWLASVALVLGISFALPASLGLARLSRRRAEAILRALAISQTVPSLALLGFLIPFLGVGAVPAIVALWIYSLFPIVRAAYSGLRDADPAAVDSAIALGMTEQQVLRQVRLPLAASSIMAGVRTAAVLSIGTATLAAFIGAGGLGEPIISGLQLVDTRRILSGAIPAALLAVAADFSLGIVERRLSPPNQRAR
jgi:osmoprotectant transport system permease protein